jgi:TRAP-type mannitol/chloroaromatic compound transport system permease large subunit
VTGLQIGTTLFATMLLLMSLRVPIAASIFVPSAVGYWWMADGNLLFNELEGLALARFSVYDLSVIPLFILTGQFATQGGLSRAALRFCNTLVGHYRGGMATRQSDSAS